MAKTTSHEHTIEQLAVEVEQIAARRADVLMRIAEVELLQSDTLPRVAALDGPLSGKTAHDKTTTLLLQLRAELDNVRAEHDQARLRLMQARAQKALVEAEKLLTVMGSLCDELDAQHLQGAKRWSQLVEAVTRYRALAHELERAQMLPQGWPPRMAIRDPYFALRLRLKGYASDALNVPRFMWPNFDMFWGWKPDDGAHTMRQALNIP